MNKIVDTLIVLMIVTVACNSFTNFPIGDGGVITGQPCAAPCFFGIRVNETPFEQVLPTLERYKINSCAQDNNLTILCNNRILIGANSSTSIVDSIGYYPDSTVHIDEIILKYGTPDNIHVVPSSIPETPKTVMLLFFDESGMRVRLPETDGFDYTVLTTIPVELINYFDAANYAMVKESQFSQPWKGYGTYQFNH
jgi:hypothetical protein